MDAQIINGQIANFAYKLEKSISQYEQGLSASDGFESHLFTLIEDTKNFNPWMMSEHLVFAFKIFSSDLLRIINFVDGQEKTTKKNIALLFRTNAPLEGIIELIYLSLQGHALQVQTQPELKNYFKNLLDLFAEVPTLSENIIITEGKFVNMDALIALAPLSNTAIQYFSKFPSLQLYSEGSSQILQENQISDGLDFIADPCCMFFGRSSMNVKILFVPDGFNEISLQHTFDKYAQQLFHNRYFNNYEYRKSVLIINRIPFMEAGPLLITEDERQAGYTGVLLVKKYSEVEMVYQDKLTKRFPIVSNSVKSHNRTAQLSSFDVSIPKILRFLKDIE